MESCLGALSSSYIFLFGILTEDSFVSRLIVSVYLADVFFLKLNLISSRAGGFYNLDEKEITIEK